MDVILRVSSLVSRLMEQISHQVHSKYFWNAQGIHFFKWMRMALLHGRFDNNNKTKEHMKQNNVRPTILGSVATFILLKKYVSIS